MNKHDLRRTFITIAEGLDIPAYALKRLLNHKMHNDVTAGVYRLRSGKTETSYAKDYRLHVKAYGYIKTKEIGRK